MEAIGKRIATVRRERQLSQSELGRRAGLGQPRVSKLEQGKLAVSAEVVDRIAAALETSGRELVRGTDRQHSYDQAQPIEEQVAARVAETERAAQTVFLASALYERIYALFEAVYGGMVAPQISGEAAYIELRENCRRVLAELQTLSPGLELYFPEHLEWDDEFDLKVDEWHDERPLVKASLRRLLEVAAMYGRPSIAVQRGLIRWLKLDKLDLQISRLRRHREKTEAEWRKRLRIES